MNIQEQRRKMAAYWMNKAEESLETAKLLLSKGHISFCTNRLYYAVFYAVSAVLIIRGTAYSKHSAVRSAFHRYFIKSGEIPKHFSEFYDQLFYDRQEADYSVFAEFDSDVINNEIIMAEEFIIVFRNILKQEESGF
jgi:uncharacterized protein (UPF0332 family)